MKHKDLPNTAEEGEILSDDDRKLRAMLGSLKKVDAPKDFDFRLKARIANAKPQDFQKTSLFPVLRYVLPLSVVILLLTFVGLNISLSPENENAPPQIAENFQPAKAETSNLPTEIPASVPFDEPVITSLDTEKTSETKISPPVVAILPKKAVAKKPVFIAAKQTATEPPESAEIDPDEGFLGTKEEASKPPIVITAPGNSNSDPVVAAPPNEAPNTKISLKEILSQIGIEADFTDAKWKIVSLKESSPALRSGMKVGDLIEAIDDKKLSSDTEFLKTASGKVFQILRDGKQVLIELNLK